MQPIHTYLNPDLEEMYEQVKGAFATGLILDASTGRMRYKGKGVKVEKKKNGDRVITLVTSRRKYKLNLRYIVGYYVWGAQVFDAGVTIRHLDGDVGNCKPRNLLLER